MWYNIHMVNDLHNTMTEKVKGSIYKPPQERPEETKLELSDYIEDAKVRWQIHLYEWDEFTKDVIVPLARTSYDWSVKTFHSIREQVKNQGSGTVEKESTDRVGGDMDKL